MDWRRRIRFFPSSQVNKPPALKSLPDGDHYSQLSLFTAEPTSPALRTIHYLGSKARALGAIREAIADVTPRGGTICDLFAGSGTVSIGMAPFWNLIAVDIQEYSRVLCNGLLNPPENTDEIGASIVHAAKTSELRRALQDSLADLLEYEMQCMMDVTNDSMDALYCIIEHGPLVATQCDKRNTPPILNAILDEARLRLCRLDHDKNVSSVITRYFGGVFFSWKQAIDLDSILESIHMLDNTRRDFFLAVALIVASNVVNTVGKHFAQPIKLRDATGRLKGHLVKQTIRDRSICIFDDLEDCLRRFSTIARSINRHRAIRADYRDILSDERIHFDAVYADPPYTRDHYSRYYHVLETMALRDEPEISTTAIRTGGSRRLSRGIYRTDRHQSPFCIKTKAPDAFDELCAMVARRGIPLVLSYSPYRERTGNRPRLLKIDQLLNIVHRYFTKTEKRSINNVSHNKFNLTERNVSVDYSAEILLVCHPYSYI